MARGKGRPAGFTMDPAHRTRIANSQIMNRLIKIAEGKVENPNSVEVQAGIALMRKVMPDMTENKNDTTLTDTRLKLTKTVQSVPVEPVQDDDTPDVVH